MVRTKSNEVNRLTKLKSRPRGFGERTPTPPPAADPESDSEVDESFNNESDNNDI